MIMKKAARKSNIALRHLLNQFDKDDQLVGLIPEVILKMNSYQELIKTTTSLSDKNIEEFENAYSDLIKDIESLEVVLFEENKKILNLITDRYKMLKK